MPGAGGLAHLDPAAGQLDAHHDRSGQYPVGEGDEDGAQGVVPDHPRRGAQRPVGPAPDARGSGGLAFRRPEGRGEQVPDPVGVPGEGRVDEVLLEPEGGRRVRVQLADQIVGGVEEAPVRGQAVAEECRDGGVEDHPARGGGRDQRATPQVPLGADGHAGCQAQACPPQETGLDPHSERHGGGQRQHVRPVLLVPRDQPLGVVLADGHAHRRTARWTVRGVVVRSHSTTSRPRRWASGTRETEFGTNATTRHP